MFVPLICQCASRQTPIQFNPENLALTANDIVIIVKTISRHCSLVTLRDKTKGSFMLFALFYVIAIAILIMHFTGFLARHNLEWLVLLLAASVFPAVIYL